MRRFLWIWLTLLGAWWTAASLVSAVLFQQATRGTDAVLRPVLVTLLQAAVLWWVTRDLTPRPPLPSHTLPPGEGAPPQKALTPGPSPARGRGAGGEGLSVLPCLQCRFDPRGAAGAAMRDSKIILILLAILTFLALGFVLNLLQAILVPLVVAVFLFQIFTPLMAALRARRVPAPLAILIVLIVVSAVLFLSSWILYSTLSSFADSLPRYQQRLTEVLDHASARLVSAVPRLREPIARFRWEEALELSAITGMLAAGLGSFLVFFSDLVLILLFLVFFLLGSESFPLKLGRALNPRHAERVAEVMRNIEEQVRRYLLTKTLINLGNGAVVAVLFASFGVDFPLLWGFLTFLVHYIPQIGGVLSVGLPAVFLLLQFDSAGWALFIAALNMAVQFIIGSVVEPEVMGERLDLSPMLVLLALIFWGWLWGPWGMVLAVPITATIRIVCENVRPLQPIAVLMSDSVEGEARAPAAEAPEPSSTPVPAPEP